MEKNKKSSRLGIGIDFGIQIINRYRQELKNTNNDVEESMRISITKVFYPLFTTTLAALIGFNAMSLGQLTIMADMGKMMGYGVFFCFLAAISFVPAITIIVEKFSKSNKFNNFKNKILIKKIQNE
jgi:predicted RND superfamily exporter protein